MGRKRAQRAEFNVSEGLDATGWQLAQLIQRQEEGICFYGEALYAPAKRARSCGVQSALSYAVAHQKSEMHTPLS